MNQTNLGPQPESGGYPFLERITIPDAFLARARLTPYATALLYGRQRVTYQELVTRSQTITRALQQEGVGAETLVGVYSDDPLGIATAYFGIVMAGGALVALDPEWPRARLAQVIGEAELQFVITTEGLLADLPRALRILIQQELGYRTHARFYPPKISADQAAYVVFTSGSTGEPKGVVGLHRTITGALRSALPIPSNEIVSLSANLAFGAGVIGLFFQLLQGVAVLLVPRSIGKDPFALVEAWEEAGVTRIVAVPPQIRQLVSLGPATIQRLSGIKTVMLSGAACTPDTLASIYRLFPDATVVNAYSCLEVGTMAARWVATPDDRGCAATLGKALPGMRVYILGPQLSPLPPGMSGEIFVGSPDISRGYLNRPDLTRERFLPNPFEDAEISRLYRTGDIGRFLPNGEIEYLGRVDNQVKIRGIRIEMEEIEAALQGASSVQHCAVAAVPQGADLRLIAFASSRPGFTISTSALRRHLAALLPPYMVPSLFVVLDAIPLIENGKVDRQRLPRMVSSRPEIDTPYARPRNDLETAVALIWEKEIGIEGVGIDDHFLEIGGDSMLSVLIAVRIADCCGLSIPPVSLFEFPTVRSLAAELARLQN